MLPRLMVAAMLASPLAALAIEPGNWEMSVVTLVSGEQKPVEATRSRCFTEADARDPSRILGGAGTCEFTNKSDSGGVFTFDVACSSPLLMKGRGSVRYTAQTLEGEFTLEMAGGFGTQTAIKGRRLGPCKD